MRNRNNEGKLRLPLIIFMQVIKLKIILRTIPAIFIRERLMAFAFLAHDNYDSPRQRKNHPSHR
jgi:hypothetical protein